MRASEPLPARLRFRRVLGDRNLRRLDLGIMVLHLTMTASFVVLPDIGRSELSELSVVFVSDIDGELGTVTPQEDGTASLELAELSMKWVRHLDAEVVDFQVLSEDYAKLALLCNDRSIQLRPERLEL